MYGIPTTVGYCYRITTTSLSSFWIGQIEEYPKLQWLPLKKKNKLDAEANIIMTNAIQKS